MADHARSVDNRLTRKTWWFWGVILVLLNVWVAARMGLFDLTARVTIDGQTITVPNTFGTVDHPFHATRAATLLHSLQDGEILRWVGHHQGGYPVEFYPLGVAWLDVGIWAATFGAISVLVAHKIAVILVFLLPSLSFWLLARGDRVHPSTAVLAAAVHFSVPGHWLNGGYEELVGWGLVTNVAGASLAFLAGVALARFVLQRDFGMGILATLAAAAGAVTNPRSLFAIVVLALGVFLIAVVARREASVRQASFSAATRIGAVGLIALLMSAPVVFALFRFNEYYFFLHYEFYDPISEYWSASATAVSTLVLVLSIFTAGVLMVPRIGILARASSGIAAAGVLYALLTLWVATATVVPPLVEQLEAPRLMPFQRQVMIWLGALAVWLVLRYLATFAPSGTWRVRLFGAIPAALAIFMLIAHVRPMGFVPDEQRAFRDVSETGNEDYASLRLAVELAEDARPDGTAIFVIGNRDDWWHQQLWAPSYRDARFFYDDWMWYWHARHAGPYSPESGYWMPNPTDALEGPYLDDNGIGVVIVSDMWVPFGTPPRQSAREDPRLEAVSSVGAWDVYTVRDPASLVMNGHERPATIDVSNHEIRATFENGNGTIVVRQNWFPRWEASVDGELVPIERRDDGYMQIEVPSGAADVRLVYAVTMVDQFGRAASILGIVLLIMGAFRGSALSRRVDAQFDHNIARSSP